MEKLESFIQDGKTTSVDTETTGLDPLTESILLLQIGTDIDQYVVDLCTVVLTKPIIDYLQNRKTLKILHNAKFDYKMLRRNGICTLENVFDTMQAEQLIMNGLVQGFPSLKSVVKKYLEIDIDKSTATNFTKNGVVLDSKEIIYAANDVKYTYLVSSYQYPQLQTYNLTHLAEVEMEANLGFADMELNGFYLNSSKWMKIYEENVPKFKAIVQDLDTYILTSSAKHFATRKGNIQLDLFNDDIRKCNINWNSPAQILPILKHFLGDVKNSSSGVLEDFVTMDWATGKYTAVDEKYKIAELLLNYRGLAKASSTYGEDFLKYVHKKSGRVHPTFNPLGTDTGRVSCNKPNLQNIKADSDYRSAFTASPGYKLITADYSGCELRIIAEFSEDPVWTKAFKKGEDVHSIVASLLFDCEVTKNNENKHLRGHAKALNFGLAYGMGAGKLAKDLRISKDEGKELMKRYFKVFPKIKKYLENNGKFALVNGHTLTPSPYNRVRWFKEFEKAKTDSELQGRIERQGKNGPIQGCNADLVKKATVMVRNHIQTLNPGDWFMVNQVHDEFVIEVKEELAQKAVGDMLFLMEQAAVDLMCRVPMIAEATVADCWQK